MSKCNKINNKILNLQSHVSWREWQMKNFYFNKCIIILKLFLILIKFNHHNYTLENLINDNYKSPKYALLNFQSLFLIFNAFLQALKISLVQNKINNFKESVTYNKILLLKRLITWSSQKGAKNTFKGHSACMCHIGESWCEL